MTLTRIVEHGDSVTPADYRARGWVTIRCEPLGKRPLTLARSWSERCDEPAEFLAGENVGIRLGRPSGGLVDVDLDTDEACELAPFFLLPTAIFGRAGRPRSHWLYVASDVETTKPPRAGLELRATGAQTIFPPSIHVSGEPIVWYDTREPVRVTDLPVRFWRLAAASILARAWPEVQARHDAHNAILAIAGALWHAGWTVDDAAALLLPAAAIGGGPDTGHRAAAITDTWTTDRARWGWPTVAQVLGALDATALQRAVEHVPTIPRATGLTTDYPLTEAGDAERLLRVHADDLRWVSGIGWLVWAGARWQE